MNRSFSTEEPTIDVGLAGVLSSRRPIPRWTMLAILAHLEEAIAGTTGRTPRPGPPAVWADLPGRPGLM
jgi:hypothetical protein